jgi:hypothetical protein
MFSWWWRSGSAEGGFVADAGEVEFAQGIKPGGGELEMLLASTENGEEIALTLAPGIFGESGLGR